MILFTATDGIVIISSTECKSNCRLTVACIYIYRLKVANLNTFTLQMASTH